MGDFDAVFVEQLKVQSWALYGVGMAIIALRTYEELSAMFCCKSLANNRGVALPAQSDWAS